MNTIDANNSSEKMSFNEWSMYIRRQLELSKYKKSLEARNMSEETIKMLLNKRVNLN